MSGNQNPVSTSRFFYHCFPQWIHNGRVSSELDPTLSLLRCILKWGLLLTPETLYISDETLSSEATSIRSDQPVGLVPISQCRVCFTELAPKEIETHCAIFGPIALEFEQDALICAGAMPVFYIPRAGQKGSSIERFGLIGRTLVYRFAEIFQLLSDLADISDTLEQSSDCDEIVITSPRGDAKKVFQRDELIFLLSRLTFDRQPPRELAHTVEALAKLFYPADAVDKDELVFYREREWRIFAGPTLPSGSISQPLSEDAVAEIAPLIDGAHDPYGKGPLDATKFLLRCELLSQIADAPLASAIRRILVSRGLTRQSRIVAAEFSCQNKVHSY
jgi:Putative abortive phage resistance protein AbiGi, antitoxin